ncbi:uncharacterized protein STEHIDRAFT_146477 [Stereum hirsutum FP-91666 SS1]|uniref:uncharacterized protein n=1 Tax=Stereum hirsutum (strain FP-91666) TaxID=721885 RepID=UPI000440F99E|nr:uncharacterized protein STEHIDRAFT_146477 [Stereum hirsutum FP-91666 SS1]EIM88486.1 hypothetical protein STEHIDRAFT_146477 [Stereum hirsutum FP-91666 SS1]
MTLLIPDTELNIHSSGIRLPEASSMVVGHSSHRDDVQSVPSYCRGIGRLDFNFPLALYIVVAYSGFSVLFPCSVSSGNSSREIVYRLCAMTLSAVATLRSPCMRHNTAPKPKIRVISVSFHASVVNLLY